MVHPHFILGRVHVANLFSFLYCNFVLFVFVVLYPLLSVSLDYPSWLHLQFLSKIYPNHTVNICGIKSFLWNIRSFSIKQGKLAKISRSWTMFQSLVSTELLYIQGSIYQWQALSDGKCMLDTYEYFSHAMDRHILDSYILQYF